MNLPVTTILGAAAPVFLLLGLGLVLRRTGVLRREADDSLMKMIIRVFYPCLFLDFIVGNPALAEAGNLVAAPLIGFGAITGGFLAGLAGARLLGLQRGEGQRTFAFGNGIFNFGYIPIPVMLALFEDRRGLGVLLVHNVGVEVAIWTVGIVVLTGQLRLRDLRRFFNPPLLALAVALGINFAGWAPLVPGWLDSLIGMLAACSIPLGIILAGASIADLLAERGLFRSWKVPAGALLLRLGLLPAGFLAVGVLIPGLSEEMRQVLMIQAAMPAGIFPIVLARHYGGSPRVAIEIVLTTTAASVVTMPLWIRVGASLLFPGN